MNKKRKSETLKIAMLGHKRIPSREGGVEIVVEELATRMVRLGHEVTCYNRTGHHVCGKEFDPKKMKVYRGVRLKKVFAINRKGLSAASASIAATLRAACGGYDVIHFHAEGPCAMLWLPKLFGRRCVVTIHGLDHRRAKWGFFASCYIMLGERVAVRFADEIIVLSKGVQKYFKDTYGRKTRFVPNGVTRPKRREAELIRRKFGLKEDGYILYLGRIVPEKGLLYLIEAYRRLHTDKKLVIAGGTSDTNRYVCEMRKLANGDDNIIFTGFVQGAMLDELYSNAYIYALPSDLEGMPLSLLEAMSYGNCCVVSDISECTDVVEDKAMIFKKGDVADLAEKLQQACDDELMVKEYKRQAADFVCNKYSWDDVVTKTLDLYYGR